VITKEGKRFFDSSIEKVLHKSSVESKMKSHNIATFYQAGKVLGMEDLQRAVMHVCSKEPELLAKDCSLADIADIEFRRRVWEARKMNPDQKSKLLSKACVRLWSENLAHFFDKHPGIADLQTFRELTHADSLCIISAGVTISLMEQEHRLCLDKKSDKEDALTCLQSRCIEALYNTKTGGWQISCPPDAIRGRLRKLPSIVLESILLKTMEYRGPNSPMAVVSGAGSNFVNGVYKMSGWIDGAITFTRWGVYEGNPLQFTLSREYDEGSWGISIPREYYDGRTDFDEVNLYFYENRSREEESKHPLPPTPKWDTSG
jgi:hypothetical protein